MLPTQPHSSKEHDHREGALVEGGESAEVVDEDGGGGCNSRILNVAKDLKILTSKQYLR